MSFRNKKFTVTIFSIIIIGFTQGVQAAYLRCYNGTLDNPLITPLESPLPLMKNTSCIDKNRVTVFYVFGLDRYPSSNDTIAVLTAYIAKGDVNLLLLDWEAEAQIGNFGTAIGYITAVSNADKVAKQFATTLMTMAGVGLDLNKVHLVGHSLGAQISGMTGNSVNTQGGHLARITGLDPAKPLYEGFIFYLDALKETSARFVDVIHSNPGQYGISKSKGTVDFWPNYQPGSSIQPGCSQGLFKILSEKSLCSHERAWMYFAESIYDGYAFPAAGEPDYDTWIKNNGTTDTIAYMGEYVSQEARGNFYLVTNSEAPFGKGDAGTKPNE